MALLQKVQFNNTVHYLLHAASGYSTFIQNGGYIII